MPRFLSPQKSKRIDRFTLLASLAFIGILVLTPIINSNILDFRQRAATDSSAYVTRIGKHFYLQGQEYRFVGFNLFDAAGSFANSPYSCPQANGWFPKYSETELDEAFREMKNQAGASVVRFWAFQKYTQGGTNWSGIDNVIALAKKYNLKVLPVLEDGPGYCTEPGEGGNNRIEKWKYNNDSWYTEGYKVINQGYTLSYRDYVKAIVTRYKDEPEIFAWMMVNEADTSKKNAQGKSVLIDFGKDIGDLIKSIDSNHLVTLGTQSNGASGATGQDFIDVYGLPVLDFAEGHDWGYWGNDSAAIPGGVTNPDSTMSLPDPKSPDCLKTYGAKIGCSLAQSIQILNKPFVMGEVGIAASDATSRQKRADLMKNKIQSFFQNSGAAYIYWQWNKVRDSQQYDVLLNTNDPLLPLFKEYADRFSITPTVSSYIPSPTSVPTNLPTAVPTRILPTISPTSTSGLTILLDDSIMGRELNQFTFIGSHWRLCTTCGNGLYNGTSHVNSTAGEYMLVTFTGKQIALYGGTNTNHGIGQVSINGKYLQNVNFYSPTRKENTLLWTSPMLSQGTYTLLFRVSSTKTTNSSGTIVEIDKVIVSK